MSEKRSSFYERVIELIKDIPEGKVTTYGQIAEFAGNRRAARQVAYILHSSTEKCNLPWHRVVNSRGEISLEESGYKEQIKLLEKEGIDFDENNRINLEYFGWEIGGKNA